MSNIESLRQKLPKTIEIFPDHAVIIDQRHLPRKLVREKLTSADDCFRAISEMHIRGAQAIGGCGIAGMVLAARKSPMNLEEAAGKLIKARPTAVNLSWGVNKMLTAAKQATGDAAEAVFVEAEKIFTSEIANNVKLGEYGAQLLEDGMNLQTHCNAGSLSSLWYGTATAPMYTAFTQGKKLHVFVDETRPRLQGARLTAWELAQVGIDYTIVTDNACGSILGQGKVDAIIVGADRIAANGDVANKIGTYPLALMAHEHDIPFYVAAVEATIDLALTSGDQIPIEERSQVEFWDYLDPELVDEKMPAKNIAFDVTSAKYVTKIITEKGVREPSDLKN